ncbi:hypothetical protein HC891_12830 [Candidatus Gracilibacteria bacterium]|nr:hypothetical protein [Candidatus Gracilibacteria bacterium]
MIQRWQTGLFGLILVLVVLILPLPTQAQTSERCFPETGYCIDGAIRAYWERNGALPVFGYPKTAQRVETVEGRTLHVQWFERDRLEIQSDGTVTAGRLGARLLDLTWRPWRNFPQTSAQPGCRFFPETGHSICDKFDRYWQANGGLERFGYALTEPFVETIEGRDYLVQYFERRRMELHPELPGAPILLGLLGNEVQTFSTNINRVTGECLANMAGEMRRAYAKLTTPEVLGCPALYAPNGMAASIQRMERGEMIWFDAPDGPIPGGVLNDMIFGYIQWPGQLLASYRNYDDTWQEGVDPEVPPFTAPVGLYAPWRGFGKAWANDSVLREQIGWAIEPQAQTRLGEYQIFDGGLLVRIYEPGTGGTVYAFGGYGNFSMVQRVVP